MKVAIRSSVIVFALALSVASAGTVLCEMDCAAGGNLDAAAASNAGASGGATSHCDGDQMGLTRHDGPASHGSSSGNTKHGGAHLHPRIVSTAAAKIQISPKHAFSDFAVNSIALRSDVFARLERNLWNISSSPPINFPAVFSADVLRI